MVQTPISAVLSLCAAVCLALAASAQPLATEILPDQGPRVFDVDALNPQLGAPPDDLDRTNPRAVVTQLLHLVEAGALQQAAHLLNVTGMDGVDDAQAAGALAADLAILLDRAVRIDWRRVTARSDGLLDTAPPDAPLAGQVRRSVLLGRVEMDPQPVPVRLNRVQPPDGPPVWVFARNTVAHVPDMIARHGPSDLELALPDDLRREAWLGLMWWELLALPLWLGLVALTAWIVWRTVGWLGRRAKLVRVARVPAALLASTGLAAWLLANFFAFSSEISQIAQPLVVLGLALAVLLFVLRVFDVIIEDLVSFDDATLQSAGEERRRAIATRVSALRRALLLVLVVAAAVIALHEAQLASGLGLSVVASAGLLTLVFGFAARTILGNILASMQIALNQSARIGDKVMFRDRLCHVERLHFTYVQLRVWTGVRLIVPVSEFVAEPFENWTKQDRTMTRLITLRLAHSADLDGLRADFDKIMDTLDADQLDDRSGAFVMVTDQDLFSQTVMFGLPCSNPDTAWRLSCEAREKLIAAAVEREAAGDTVFAEVKATEAA